MLQWKAWTLTEDSNLRTPTWGFRLEDSDLWTPTWGLRLEDSDLRTYSNSNCSHLEVWVIEETLGPLLKLSKKWSVCFFNYSYFQMTTVKGQGCWRFVLNSSFWIQPWFLLKPLLIYGNFGPKWRLFFFKRQNLCVWSRQITSSNEMGCTVGADDWLARNFFQNKD